MSNFMSEPLSTVLTSQLAALARGAQGIAVALSGGADSWALALLVYDYCKTNHHPFIALTVDHRLRPESTAEADSVAAECARRGIPHRTLVWRHEGIASRRQELARAARYTLLADYCESHGFSHLLTAHHADDQAETVLLRFARGSGARGLAGMAASRPLTHNVTLLRPFLAISKTGLAAYAEAAGVPIAADPSNADPRYARARLRAARDLLAAEGLTTETLLKTAAAAAAEAAALGYAAQRLILDHARFSPYGAVTLPATKFAEAPPMLRRYAWLEIWRHVTRSPGYPPPPAAIDAACRKLAGDRPVKRTLGGMVQIHKITGKAPALIFTRETAALTRLPLHILQHSEAIFDRRYMVINKTSQALVVLPGHGRPNHIKLTPWVADLKLADTEWIGFPNALWAGTPDDPLAGGPILPLRLMAKGETPAEDAKVFAYLLDYPDRTQEVIVS